MDQETDTRLHSEHVFAETECQRKLKEEIVTLEPKRWPRLYEAIALAIWVIAIDELFSHLSLNKTDQYLVLLGLIAPIAVLASKLHKSEKRIDALIKLLNKNKIL